ncbi:MULTISPECIES: efflux RND transporter periplasmic adaptor subunit [Rhizobium]|uniref:Macrolide-specific efflux system membrane fusion protein n=4 Tax=Rhizobium TaxID=379 RepID=A0A7W6UTJ9_9HYPH|nr:MULTISPECIES: efflux RND transporter periplasmic adaptor subunit [Rhizobium]AVC52528.1 efflux transporter, RND family, MFP subunit [Rhizobium leguminosarum bv. viciae]MBB4346197.1 macrolide-specific efflux system membrane fusion protein [Rhizobium leguminosarum]MBB4444119.1 macrolide-specific efflux system membrane fusion protein [Rhizobium esperanzae]MBB5262800.1 macrolide-specific efflux system membrane fusion protein [Rhizobium leguminosarum]MBB6299324.1 macrolide-specific efflux system 
MKIKMGLPVWGLGVAPLMFAIAVATSAFKQETLDPVHTERVVLGSIEETVLAEGVLEPRRIINVGAQVSGQIKALHVKLGQFVKSGDLIAEIDPTKEQYKLLTAQANLANVNARRKEAEITLNEAKLAFRRQKTLRENRSVSAADLEKAQATFLSQEARLEQLEAQTNEKILDVDVARSSLNQTKISAPMSGVVVALATKEGQTLNSDRVPTIAVLAQLDVMQVMVQISEADMARVKPGQNVRFTTLGATEAPSSGVLEEIQPAPPWIADDVNTGPIKNGESNRAVYYTGVFPTPNPEGRFRPKMSVSVTIIFGHAENVPLVPWAALSEPDGKDRYRVYVRKPTGEVTVRLVTTGLTDKIKAQVLNGLSVGDELLISPSEKATGLEAI